MNFQKNTSPLESKYQRKLKKKLDSRETLYCFVKEAKAIRGIPDIIGVYNSVFFALEVKRNKAEASKRTGRIALQRYVMKQMRNCGAFVAFIYPENEDEVLTALDKYAATCQCMHVAPSNFLE